jgi:uncharacterized tellurite resistance protein B-like protein
MDEFLADLFDTSNNISSLSGGQPAEDLEKLAQAHLMSEMLAADGFDVNKLTDDTVAKVASVLGFQAAPAPTAPAPAAAPTEKVASTEELLTAAGKEKVAEAQALGKVIAHSYVRELAELNQKTAAAEAASAPAAPAANGALEKLAEARLAAWIQEQQAAQPAAAPADETTKLAEAIDQRAYQIAVERGIIVEEGQ